MLRIVQLDHLRVIAASGPDRNVFLQGQLTQEVARASDAVTSLAGWADARGRLLWAGHLFTGTDSLCLLVPAAAANALAARLKLFVLRARVRLEIPDLRLVGILAGQDGHDIPRAPPGGQLLRLAADSGRALLIAAQAGASPGYPHAARGSVDEWRLRDIRAGLPEVLPATSGEFVPQMLNLDLLDGISFSKGCYTGQEIVARTRFLGRVKRRMLRFSVAGDPPPAGSAVYGEQGNIGQVVSAAPISGRSELLAVMRLDELKGDCFLDATRGRPLTRLSLPYEIPEAGTG